MSVSADEINFLIRRYLQETGFTHTAYIFGNECMLDEANIHVSQLPPQALVTILKKGMLYMQMEKGINEKAKTNSSPESIILSLVDIVRHEEPIVPIKQQPSHGSRSVQQTIHVKPSNSSSNTTNISSGNQQKKIQSPPQLQKITNPFSIDISKALVLKGHTTDVYCGAWTRDGKRLATGSGDATASIWEIKNHRVVQSYTLDHATQQDRSGKDIATLAWNPSGNILATGCYDGTARLWTSDGNLKFVLMFHDQPVFTVQFSPDGNLLLTGSADQKAVAWNVATGERKQIFQNHQSRVLDVDWKDNQMFASCSGDTRIAVCQIDKPHPLIILEGHTGEVNKIEWDSSGRLLASCSDDKTVRVWRPFDKILPVILNGHTHHVYTITWCPGNRKWLASGAFDYTVRIWDVLNQTCLYTLSKHTQPIYTICFSPMGRFFVSGGIDNVMNMFRTEDGTLVATFNVNSGIFEAHWDPTGQNIALCLADSRVVVLATKDIPYYQE